MSRVKVAMIGVGAISGIYLENLTKTFTEVELIGVCDLIRPRAEKAQQDYSIPKLYETMEDAFADEEVEIILNLTRPYEHFEVGKAALEAGKHLYEEKPLGADLAEGLELVRRAREKGLLLGGAPDTCLGAGIQTCRRLIDHGMIGEPIGAAARMVCHGHETWHPDPAFYYQRGGGPMMDMGPYYITALVNLMGGISGVMGMTRKTFPQRIITSQPHFGEVVDVDVATHLAGLLQFETGAVGTILTTFDVHYKGVAQSPIEIYGSEGTLLVPDPNTFGGPIRLLRPEDGEPKEIPLMFDYSQNSRGLGLADMARALRTNRPPRCDYEQTLHVLEVLTAFEKSSGEGAFQPIHNAYRRPEPMKNNPLPGVLD